MVADADASIGAQADIEEEGEGAPAADLSVDERLDVWGGIARSFAGVIASDGFDRAAAADLRNLDPNAAPPGAFYRLMAPRGILGAADEPPDLEFESKWQTIIGGAALMARTSRDLDFSDRSPHSDFIPVGRALYEGGTQGRSTPFYRETLLNQLLAARGDAFRLKLAGAFKALSRVRQHMDLRELAVWVLSDGYCEERFQEARRRVAREYYRSQSYAESMSRGGGQ